ncbi:SCO family protein [Luteimonas sp. BDR2-5]|uniref:SCO family protein n=1 Tax=Proluteimonas luteida TaxID=2878685 RepID=UPI001E2C1E73|nr:SCO family protein [Luteimonas sp. BDR2-5]MCD9029944.1 SCO family protein [Luteimonas sp. BDR2-5]
MFNRTTLVILAIALAGGLGLLAAQKFFAATDPARSQPALQVVQLYPQPRTLPAFALQQSDGTQLLSGELAGHWTLVFIGFTHCPDVCPMTLTHLAQAQRQWEALPEATRPRVLFVSVDPERDTPAALGEYAHAFHRDTLAATADIATLEQFARSLSMVFAKVPLGDSAPEGAYTVDHSASLAVLDPQGRMAGVVSGSVLNAETPQPDAIAADLLRLTEGATP